MRTIADITFVGLLVALALYVQQGGFFAIHAIAPNILLIALVCLVCRDVRVYPLIVVLAGMLLYAFFVTPFWFAGFAVLACLVLIARVLRARLTGNATADFFVLIAGCTVALYGVLALFRISPFSFSAIAWDLVYTMSLGAVLWLGTIRYDKKSYSI